MHRTLLIWTVLAGMSYFFASDAASAPSEVPVASPFPAITVHDARGHSVALPGKTRWLLLVRSRAVDHEVAPILAAAGRQELVRHRLRYLLDLGQAPAFAVHLFVLPQLRRRAYPVLVVRSSRRIAELSPFMGGKGCASLVRFVHGHQRGVQALCNPEQMRQRLRFLGSATRHDVNSR